MAYPLPDVALPAPSPHSGEREQLHKHRLRQGGSRDVRSRLSCSRMPHAPCPMLALTDAFLGEPACVWHLGLRSGGQEGGKVAA